MIIRPEQHWFLRLFDWHGSVLSKIIFRLLLNVLMSIIAIIRGAAAVTAHPRQRCDAGWLYGLYADPV